MNQNFSFKRYVWLLKRQWYENAAIYKWGIVLMALLIVAIFGLFLWASSWENAGNDLPLQLGQMAAFGATGIVFLFIYSANFFESITSKNRKMFYFSLPVSPLERVAVAFTFVVVFMPILILTVFSFFDLIAVHLFNHIHGVSMQMFFKTRVPLDSLNPMFVNILGYLSYASVFTLGSLMFGKRGSVISIAFLIAFFVICQWLWNLFSDTLHPTFVIDYIKNYIFIYLLPICWAEMYFVMKRKEV